ncbi:MAG TPA: 1,4-dihydroxy-2-naphthoate polyprenyltransferase [Thermoanaerobaculia bacterium]
MRGKLGAWLLAARPKTLAAAVAPVAVGTAVAYDQGGFAPLPALGCLLTALLLQVGANFANDYFDFVHGADTEERIGPARAVATGLLTPGEMRAGTVAVFALAGLGGVYLALVAGWPLVVIGLASIAAAVGYTAGGRRSIGYLGLGDVTVFVFFGLAAVAGTAYVQLLSWPAEALWAAVPVGCLAVAILVVNNYRDADTDRASGKRTLAVRLGRGFARGEYLALLALAFAAPALHWAAGWDGPWVLLAWLSLPLAVPPVRKLLGRVEGPALNRALGETARLMVAFGALYALGIALPE